MTRVGAVHARRDVVDRRAAVRGVAAERHAVPVDAAVGVLVVHHRAVELGGIGGALIAHRFELRDVDGVGVGSAGGDVRDLALVADGADRDGARAVGDRALPQGDSVVRGGAGLIAESGGVRARRAGLVA